MPLEQELILPSVNRVATRHSSLEGNTWAKADAQEIYELPFNDLLFRAHSVHRENFDPNQVQLSKLLSIKTGGCPEDCGYCSQSARSATGLNASKLMDVDHVVDEARKAKEGGATRYCMGAAWRSPKQRDMDVVVAMVKGVKALNLETCMTLGMLSKEQAETLAEAGLDYYNHNIDTSERFYPQIITTRSFGDRRASIAATTSISEMVVQGFEPEIFRLSLPRTITAPQPPGPGFPITDPSV